MGYEAPAACAPAGDLTPQSASWETDMYAIIDDNGKQYKVEEGQRLLVDLKTAKTGDLIEFDKVLLVGGENTTAKVGTPALLNARVIAEVMGEEKGKKVINMRFRKRKDSRRKKGHRERYTQVLVREIHPE